MVPISSPSSSSLVLDSVSPHSNNNSSLVRDSLLLSPLIGFSSAKSDELVTMVEFNRPTKSTAPEKVDLSFSSVARAVNIVINLSEIVLRTLYKNLYNIAQ